jgi:phosphotransferase system enzyme I (PtsI)
VEQHEEQLHGIPASEGVAIGRAHIFSDMAAQDGFCILTRDVPAGELDDEVARFVTALDATRTQIQAAQRELADRAGHQHARIFDAHLLLLEDRDFINAVVKRIRDERRNAEAVFMDVTREYLRAFDQIDDDYLRERTADIRDITRRVIHNLVGAERPGVPALGKDVIVVAHDLSPSDTAVMDRERVIGMVTEVGGPTSHTAIMARAMGIPAVTGTSGITAAVRDNDLLIVDGHRGLVFVNPGQAQIDEYERARASEAERLARLAQLRDVEARTTDGRSVRLYANIETPEEVRRAMDAGAQGVGLYRTEFFFMNRRDLPSEDEQFEAYAQVVRRCGDKPVVIRTLDLGGDKYVSALSLPREMNPFMGWRAIRLCLERTDIFKAQLRAILRASAEGRDVRVMFPMVTTVQEVRAAKALIAEAGDELRREGRPFNESIPIGAMIEIPSAALTCDLIAEEVDFLSIGTNDLIQYTLAIDRVNEKTAHMYDPTNLAVLRLVKNVIDVAHKERCQAAEGGLQRPSCLLGRARESGDIPVCVCGEVASVPMMAYLLIGLGIDELSTVAGSIPRNKELVRAVSYDEARAVADEALRLRSSDEVAELLAEHLPVLNSD